MEAVLEAIKNGTFVEEQAHRVYMARSAARLTRRELARRIGMDAKILERIEKGVREVKTSELYLIAQGTGQSYGYLALHHDHFNDRPVPGIFHFRLRPSGHRGSGGEVAEVIDRLFQEGAN